jgi:tetratricopeptide (TPR) repeat protein
MTGNQMGNKCYIAALFMLMSGLNICLAKEFNNNTCDLDSLSHMANTRNDFNNPAHKEKITRVVSAHFTPEVAALIRGESTSDLHADIYYTLRSIPNHYSALTSVEKLERRDKLREGDLYQTRYYSAACYFKRAIFLHPKDSILFQLLAIHLHKIKDYDAALEAYKQALNLTPGNIEVHYNIGLLYVEMKDYTQGKFHADKAYKAGFPLPGLRNKLAQLHASKTK